MAVRMLMRIEVKLTRTTWDMAVWSRPMGGRRGPWRYDPGVDAEGYHFRAFTWGVLHMTWFTTPRPDPVFTSRPPTIRPLETANAD